jgi:signal recognition particle subunit SRP54
MFEALTDRLTEVFQRIGRKGRLTEPDVDEALREVRRALLEADVNYRVVKDFIAAVREQAIGEHVLRSLTPVQQVISIVHKELVRVLGSEPAPLVTAAQPPTVILLVGLQGSGKTTHVAKLGYHLRREGRQPLLVAADVYRPAAVEQLCTLGRQHDLPIYDEGIQVNPVEIVKHAIALARERRFDPVVVDTAGRLQIDERMMQELEEIKAAARPSEILLVADAMTGQEAVSVAEEFHRRLQLTGLILTKMDGDARGGAALSIRSVVGVPIKFIGTGERVTALEPFYPDRLARRILGMGDVLSLIEKAQQQISQEESERLQEKVLTGTFNLEDFLHQLQQIKRMGPLTQLLEMLPGVGQALRQQQVRISDDEYKHIEAIILSMTPEERRHPHIIDFSRRRRIARGSGTSMAAVNQLLNQFKQMQRMMAELGQIAGTGRRAAGLRGLLSGHPLPGLGGSLDTFMAPETLPRGLSARSPAQAAAQRPRPKAAKKGKKHKKKRH